MLEVDALGFWMGERTCSGMVNVLGFGVESICWSIMSCRVLRSPALEVLDPDR
jgi:hypothetical protein